MTRVSEDRFVLIASAESAFVSDGSTAAAKAGASVRANAGRGPQNGGVLLG